MNVFFSLVNCGIKCRKGESGTNLHVISGCSAILECLVQHVISSICDKNKKIAGKHVCSSFNLHSGGGMVVFCLIQHILEAL